MNIPDPIQLTQDLIRFNTINPPGNEDELCDYLTQLLKSAHFECMNVDFAPRRRSVVARIPGKPLAVQRQVIAAIKKALRKAK